MTSQSGPPSEKMFARLDAEGNSSTNLVPVWGDAMDPTLLAGNPAANNGTPQVNDWGTPVLTPKQQKCVDDHTAAAAAIGTNALNSATKTFTNSVPSVDWAGGFAINQFIRNVAAGGPIQWLSVVEAAGIGLVARAGWGTLKGAGIAM